jgi:hypothetical protein
MEMIHFPKRRFKLVLHSTKSQKTSLIDTAMKAFQETEVFQYYLSPSMVRLSNSISMVIQLWKPINLGNPADGDDTFSETLVQVSATRYKVPEDIFDTAMKAFQKQQSSSINYIEIACIQHTDFVIPVLYDQTSHLCNQLEHN